MSRSNVRRRVCSWAAALLWPALFACAASRPSGELEASAGAGTARDAAGEQGDAGAPAGGSGGTAADACPANPSGSQSERADCPLFCPPTAPAEGLPCADRAHVCRYEDLSWCECRSADFNWQCMVPECRWHAASGGWRGERCDECPIVAQPQPNTAYGSCSASAPECWLHEFGHYQCVAAQYRFVVIAPP